MFIRKLLVVIALACGQHGVMAEEQYYTIPVVQSGRWIESLIYVRPSVPSEEQYEELDGARQLCVQVADAIVENDYERFSKLSRFSPEGTTEGSDLAKKSLEGLRSMLVINDTADAPTKVVDLFDTGKFIVGLVEIAPTSNSPFPTKLCIPVRKLPKGDWMADWSNETRTARETLQGLLLPRNGNTEYVSQAVEKLPPGAFHEVKSWIFGSESEGWLPARVLLAGRSAESPGELQVVLDAHRRMIGIIESIRAVELTEANKQEFLSSLDAWSRKRASEKYGSNAEDFKDWCISHAPSGEIAYCIDGGEVYFLLTKRCSDWDSGNGSTCSFEGIYQFSMEGEKCVRSDFGVLSPIGKFLRSIEYKNLVTE